MTAEIEVANALRALYALKPPRSAIDRFLSARHKDDCPFAALHEACSRLLGEDVQITRWQFSRAMLNIGWPGLDASGIRTVTIAPDVAAQRLIDATLATSCRRSYFCPLDWASEDLPGFQFGPNRVARLTQDDLSKAIDPARLMRHHPKWTFDASRFSEFRWLVIEEEIKLDHGRLTADLWEVLDTDYDGRISTHQHDYMQGVQLFPAVERALFALLLLPWESAVESAAFDWRPFHFRWNYTVNSDLFAQPSPPPDATTLTWRTAAVFECDGEEIEIERPEEWPLIVERLEPCRMLDDEQWRKIEAALRSPLFETPICHFLVRGFLSRGIDEFISHLIAIEAALGLEADFKTRQSSLFRRRAEALRALPELTKVRLGELGDRRNEYIHGRATTDIPASDRLDARRFARAVASTLVDNSQEEHAKTRESFLRSLEVVDII